MFCPNPIPHHESPPPLCLSDRRMWFTRSFSLQNGRNASVPHRPPHRDLQKRPGLNESICPRVPFQSTTKTLQTSSPKKPLPISPLLLSAVRVHLRPGTYHVLVLTELRWICRTGAQGDRSLLNALSRKCYMHMLQYVHRGTLP